MFIQQLTSIAEKIINDMRKDLVSNDINACGGLNRSLEYRVSEHLIEIEFNKYGEFVDSGTKPRTGTKGPGFLDQIKEWTKCKGIPEEAAYPIYKHILEHGTKPQKWINFRKHIMNIDQEILDMMGIFIDTQINDRLKKIWL